MTVGQTRTWRSASGCDERYGRAPTGLPQAEDPDSDEAVRRRRFSLSWGWRDVRPTVRRPAAVRMGRGGRRRRARRRGRGDALRADRGADPAPNTPPPLTPPPPAADSHGGADPAPDIPPTDDAAGSSHRRRRWQRAAVGRSAASRAGAVRARAHLAYAHKRSIIRYPAACRRLPHTRAALARMR